MPVLPVPKLPSRRYPLKEQSAVVLIVSVLLAVMSFSDFGVFDHARAGRVVDAGQRLVVAEHLEIGILRAGDAGESSSWPSRRFDCSP